MLGVSRHEILKPKNEIACVPGHFVAPSNAKMSKLLDTSAVHKAAVLTEKNVSESKSVPGKEIDQLLYDDQKNGDISKNAERGFKEESDDGDFPVWMLGGKTGRVYFSSKPPAEGDGVEDYFPLMTYDPPQQIMDALNAAGEHQCVPMEAVYPNDSHMEPESLCELRAFLRSDAVNEIFDEVLNEGATEKPKPIVTIKKPSPNVPGNTKGSQVDQKKPLPRMNKENERDVVNTEKAKTERSRDECMNVAMVTGRHAEFTRFRRPQRIKKIPVRLLDYVRYAGNSEEVVQIKSDPDSNLPITTCSNGGPTQIAEQHLLSNRGVPNKTSNNPDERCDDDYKANRSIKSEPNSNLSPSGFPTVLNQQTPSIFKQNRPQRTQKIPARLIDCDIGENYKATSIKRELDSNH